MSIDFVAVVFRWMHILAAITAVGATIFMRLVLLPAVATLDEDARQQVHEAVRSRWIVPLMVSILFLLVSGFYNFFATMNRYELSPEYQPLFGIKFLLALAIFFIASSLAGRSEATERFRRNRKTWLTVNMVLAILLVCISGILRLSEKVEKIAPPVQATDQIE